MTTGVDDFVNKTKELTRGIFKPDSDSSNTPNATTMSTTGNSLLSKSSKSSSKSSGAYLSEDVELKGTLYFSSRTEINGRIEGDIVAEGPLIIGDSAIIKASITAAATVEVRGKVQGNIAAQDRVDVTGEAQLYGDIQAPQISISDSVTFVGRSDTLSGKSPTTDFSKIFSQLDKSNGTGTPSKSSRSNSSSSD
ncbi:MAG: polymer-forming cytoskeletal protein [Verrucomicrobiota bacterium]